VSLLLQAEQKAMKISRRTDPNLFSKGLSVKLNSRLHFFVSISNPLSLIILQILLLQHRFPIIIPLNS